MLILRVLEWWYVGGNFSVFLAEMCEKKNCWKMVTWWAKAGDFHWSIAWIRWKSEKLPCIHQTWSKSDGFAKKNEDSRIGIIQFNSPCDWRFWFQNLLKKISQFHHSYAQTLKKKIVGWLLGGSSHLVSGLVHPSCKWTDPTYPIYNQGCIPFMDGWDLGWSVHQEVVK